MNPHLASIARLSDAETRSISPENPDGSRAGGARSVDGVASEAARGLGPGWKISPFVRIEAGQTFEIAQIAGPGVIRHIWLTATGDWRSMILRFYWDGQEQPSVECPLGDFFAMGWNTFAPLVSEAVCVNPGSAFNSYWPMPFASGCRITLENRAPEEIVLYYQVTYTLEKLPDSIAYLHAQFRRSHPLPYKAVHTIVDGIEGRGHFVGLYLAWGVNNNGWWGEGEVKFYLDDDDAFPTICGTGTEDYFCGSYNFENKTTRRYQEYCTPYAGLHQVIRPDGLYLSQTRFGMYRWHLPDPIHFKQRLKATVQALGWRKKEPRYLPLQDDISSTAFWYQTLPTAPFPTLPGVDELEVI